MRNPHIPIRYMFNCFIWRSFWIANVLSSGEIGLSPPSHDHRIVVHSVPTVRQFRQPHNDCIVKDNVILANNATLAGHVLVEEFAILGGLSAVHQFVRIGRHAMVGGMSGVEQDVIPYGSVLGNRARLAGLNIVGLKRRGFSRAEIASLRKAYRLLFAEEGTISERLDDVAEMYNGNQAVMDIVSFIREESNRAICQPRSSHET
mgnify:CR=1 FL=1